MIFVEKSVKQHRGAKIALIVLAALLVLAAGALVFAGNYLFNFALDPNSPGGMIGGNQNWAEEAEGTWIQENGEDRWLTSHDGLTLHALYVVPRLWQHSPVNEQFHHQVL